MDGDAVVAEGDRLGLIQKPLTGIPCPFSSSIIRRTASGVIFG